MAKGTHFNSTNPPAMTVQLAGAKNCCALRELKSSTAKATEHVLKGAAAAGEEAAKAATAKNAHCHRGSGSNLINLEGCLPAKTLLHPDERSCTLMTPSSGYEELQSSLT